MASIKVWNVVYKVLLLSYEPGPNAARTQAQAWAYTDLYPTLYSLWDYLSGEQGSFLLPMTRLWPAEAMYHLVWDTNHSTTLTKYWFCQRQGVILEPSNMAWGTLRYLDRLPSTNHKVASDYCRWVHRGTSKGLPRGQASVVPTWGSSSTAWWREVTSFVSSKFSC
jgi:hypothetical protein